LLEPFSSQTVRKSIIVRTSVTRSCIAIRALRSIVLVSALAFSGVACSDDGSKSGGDDPATESTSAAPDAKKAKEALDSGLEAHAEGDLPAATEFYETTLEYDATNQYAFYNLALIDEAGGNYGLAEEKYRAALETDPAYQPALFNLAILRTASDDTNEAISLYKRAVAADKKDAAAWLNLGLLLREAGQERAGNENVLRALALDPSLQDPAES
jgi:tetratricopeptide (TPR) repeat protein